jgi:hypothetical protein
MSKAGVNVMAGMEEAVKIAHGLQPAASVTIKGHRYVPADTIATLTAERDEWQQIAEVEASARRDFVNHAARLEEALRDAAKRLLGAGMLGGPEDPVPPSHRSTQP